MTFLLPDPRPRMRCKYTHGRGSVDVSRLGGVHVDAAQVFGADEPVLPRADQSGRGAMVAAERMAIEILGDEHVLGQGVAQAPDRPVAVEAAEDEMGDRRAWVERRLDEPPVEGLECDPLPMQVGGRPSRHAMEVGSDLAAGKGRQRGQRHGEGRGHRTADLDRRIEGDSGCRSAGARTEAGEPFDAALAGGKAHVVALGWEYEREAARQFRPMWRSISGYTIRCRNGAIAAI